MKRTILLLGACAVMVPALALAQAPGAPASEDAVAVFAGGCFWSVEKAFDGVEGVTETISGFTGGDVANPTYSQVVHGGTGHYEAVQVRYDPSVTRYDQLLETFWHTIDPRDGGGQFCDRGVSYRTAVFVGTDAERQAAEASKAEVGSVLAAEVATEILPAAEFYPAEDYHQNFHVENPGRYQAYLMGCGRVAALQAVWGGVTQ